MVTTTGIDITEAHPADPTKELLELARGRAGGSRRELVYETTTGRLVAREVGSRLSADVLPITGIAQDGFF